ncbi:hypothetical protein LZ554_008115 [Drepanopeziza brunnea f. sp. 'monogermtubi']|nr:hypothetical protein LZ554_008115 [Drepanopeziza brunnea f. sp. 'monogermtubi']
MADSSFESTPVLVGLSLLDSYMLDIKNYIPAGKSSSFLVAAVCARSPERSAAPGTFKQRADHQAGCIRVRCDDIVPSDLWYGCLDADLHGQWMAFAHPRDMLNPSGGLLIPNTLQYIFFQLPLLKPFLGLFNAAWIRMEFRANDQHRGQIRVYVLPDDFGRSVIDRSIASFRKAMVPLLAQLDISSTTWKGHWQSSRVRHVDSSLDIRYRPQSLFEMFMALPSPKPDPQLVADPWAAQAMDQILDDQVDGLKTSLHDYQRRSAAMMLQRESAPVHNLDPRLRHLTDQSGKSWYGDANAGYCFRDPRTHEAPRGGICVESMGMGKIVICLALIVASKDCTARIPEEYVHDLIPVRKSTGSLMDMAAATIGRESVPWKTTFANLEAQEGYCFERCREALEKGAGYYMLPASDDQRDPQPRKIILSAATIVVAGALLINSWQAEIKKHTVGLKVLVMKAMTDELPMPSEIASYDIILFTKKRFNKEAHEKVNVESAEDANNTLLESMVMAMETETSIATAVKNHKKILANNSPLREIHFKRLIVDEGQGFGTAPRKECLPIVDFLQLSSRWVVSGTLLDCSSSSEGSSDDADQDPNQVALYRQQERQDLDRLGSIVTSFLKAQPWVNLPGDYHPAVWSQIEQRHGSEGLGRGQGRGLECLRETMKGLVVLVQRPELAETASEDDDEDGDSDLKPQESSPDGEETIGVRRSFRISEKGKGKAKAKAEELDLTLADGRERVLALALALRSGSGSGTTSAHPHPDSVLRRQLITAMAGPSGIRGSHNYFEELEQFEQLEELEAMMASRDGGLGGEDIERFFQ